MDTTEEFYKPSMDTKKQFHGLHVEQIKVWKGCERVQLTKQINTQIVMGVQKDSRGAIQMPSQLPENFTKNIYLFLPVHIVTQKIVAHYHKISLHTIIKCLKVHYIRQLQFLPYWFKGNHCIIFKTLIIHA